MSLTIVRIQRMCKLPVGYRIGWTALGFSSPLQTWESLVGWVCVAKDEDLLPVISVYEKQPHHDPVLAETLITSLLSYLVPDEIEPGETVWVDPEEDLEDYEAICESFDLVCEPWE